MFDRGETVVDEPILYFYNPALVTSDFHESQIFVIEEGGHRFFAEREHQMKHLTEMKPGETLHLRSGRDLELESVTPVTCGVMLTFNVTEKGGC